VGHSIKEQPKAEITYTDKPGFDCDVDQVTGEIICSLISPFDMTVEGWRERNK